MSRARAVPAGTTALRLRTLGALTLLTAALPGNAAVTGALLMLGPRRRAAPATGTTVLLSGGKMTKALTLARAFHRAGHRVVLVEAAKYRLTGHRFSNCVDAFHTVPRPDDPGYADALVEIVRRERVDVYVPVCSPLSSQYDAEAKARLSEHCEVVHLGPEQLRAVDDKHAFAELARSHGLPVPASFRITDPRQLEDFPWAEHPGPFVLKSIPYDPIRRLDLTPLPRPTPEETRAFAASLPISERTPWILQAFVDGEELCTHSTVRDGRVQVHTCCRSSAFQLNYADVEVPEIDAWVRTLAAAEGFTGQVSIDFILDAGGRALAIECNPRTHSAITLFDHTPGLAEGYLRDGRPELRPRPGRPTYWLYWELWRLLAHPGRRATLGRLLRGRDAILDRDDPLPFLLVHHLQLPALLLGNLVRGKDWSRVDFNIGKLVEPAGD